MTTRLQFHGGRWDGLQVDARDAPEIVFVSAIREVTGNAINMLTGAPIEHEPEELIGLMPLSERERNQCSGDDRVYARMDNGISGIHYGPV